MKAGGIVLAVVVLVLGIAFVASSGFARPAQCDLADPTQPLSGSVAGYSGDQLVNAAVIMNTAESMGLDRHAQVLGVMAAMGESGLRVLTYGDFETSGVLNPDGTPTSPLGLFQQQDWWGTAEQRLDPVQSATLFFDKLKQVDGWQLMSDSEAIHRVQQNTDPDHYTKWQSDAETVVAALSPCAAQR